MTDRTAGGKPRLLDLFSGAGGACKGYQRAGFYVVGVDIKPQPRYCGEEFIQADALEHVKAMCNRCHLRYDVKLHVKHALDRRRAGAALGKLFA